MSLESHQSEGTAGREYPPAEEGDGSEPRIPESPLAGLHLCVIEWDQIRDVEGLLQWTKNQLQPLNLWKMPALVDRARTPTRNPVRKDNSRQMPVLVKHVLDSLEKMQTESETWQLERPTPIIDAEVRDKVLSQLTGKDFLGGPCAYLCTLGRYNVGKTLLINALLSADVLPTSQDAETAVVVYVQHHEKNEVPVLCNYSNGNVLCEGVDSIRDYLKEVQRDVRLRRALSKQEYLLRIRINCFARSSGRSLNKHQQWRTITSLLVDTPGSNEVSQKDLQSIAHLNLQTAAAYIYVMTFSDLRNNHDYAAFEKILWKDKDIFRDSRVAIVVTKMDERYQEVRESERLSDERVKQIVSEGIKKALDLDFVSPDIVFPVSGLLAFQAREFGKGEVKPLDELIYNWGSIHRSTLGVRAFMNATSMTSEELCRDLEQASNLANLESRIAAMIDKLDYIWKRSAATNCLLAIDQALVSLNAIHDALDREVQRFKQIIDDCESVRQLHRHILSSLQQDDSELLRNLDNMYMNDTRSASVVDKREMRELIDDFIFIIHEKAEKGNYLPGDLRNDLSKFREQADHVLLNVCLETKFEYCHKLIMAYVMRMSESYGRLRKTLSDLLRQSTSDGDSTALNIVAGNVDEAFGNSEPQRLDQITTEHIQVPAMKYILFGVSMIFGGKIPIRLISNEHIQVVQEDIKNLLKDAHRSFFTEIQSMITLHFFKQYCQQVVAMMRRYSCSLDGFVDVESNAKDKWREKEEQRDMCKCWIDELKRWQGRLLVELNINQ